MGIGVDAVGCRSIGERGTGRGVSAGSSGREGGALGREGGRAHQGR